MIEECENSARLLPMVFQGAIWGASMFASYAIAWAFCAKANVIKNAAPMTRDEFSTIMNELKSFPRDMTAHQTAAYDSLLNILNSRAPLGILPNEIYRKEAIKNIAAEAAKLVHENLNFEIIEEMIDGDKTNELQKQNDNRLSERDVWRRDSGGDERIRVEDTIGGVENKFGF